MLYLHLITAGLALGCAVPGTMQVKWLPINGAMTIDENYLADPQKIAGVAKANTQLNRAIMARHCLRRSLEPGQNAGACQQTKRKYQPCKNRRGGVQYCKRN